MRQLTLNLVFFLKIGGHSDKDHFGREKIKMESCEISENNEIFLMNVFIRVTTNINLYHLVSKFYNLSCNIKIRDSSDVESVEQKGFSL